MAAYRSVLIDLYRHGKVDGPPALYGQTDIACTEEGHSKLLAHLNTSAAPDIVLTSSLKRCAFTAKAFATQQDISMEILPFLQEMDFGLWDGVPFDHLTDEQESLEKFWESPAAFPPPEGETLSDFNNRIKQFWPSLNKYSSAKKVSVIAHGGVIRMLLAHALGLEYKNPSLFTSLSIDNASKTRIEVFWKDMPTFYNVKFINHTVSDENER